MTNQKTIQKTRNKPTKKPYQFSIRLSEKAYEYIHKQQLILYEKDPHKNISISQIIEDTIITFNRLTYNL